MPRLRNLPNSSLQKFFSRCFIVLSFILRSLIQFELIFVNDVKDKLKLIFKFYFAMDNQLFYATCWKDFPHWICTIV